MSVVRGKFISHCIKIKYTIIVLMYIIVTVQEIIQLCFGMSLNTKPTNSTTDNSTTMLDVTFDQIHLDKMSIYYLRLVGTCFHVGYAMANCIGGVIADLYGARYCIMFGMTFASSNTLLAPFIFAYIPWYLMAVTFFLQGCFEGIMVPARSTLCAHWIPVKEITLVIGCISTSHVISQITVKYMMYYLQKKTIHFWKLMFFFWGGVGLTVTFFAFLFVYSNPFQCKMATEQEKKDMEAVGGKNPKRINWKMMIEDEAVWAGMIDHIASTWQNYILLQEMALIIARSHLVVGPFPVQASITLWAIVIVAVGSSTLVNYLVKRGNIPVIYMRVISNVTGNLGTGVLLQFIHNTTYGEKSSLLLRPLALSIKRLNSPAGQVNVLDLTRYYAGTITGIQNGVGIFLAYLILILREGVAESPRLRDWFKMHDLSFSACLTATLLFMIWARAERARWDVVIEEDDEDEYIEEIIE